MAVLLWGCALFADMRLIWSEQNGEVFSQQVLKEKDLQERTVTPASMWVAAYGFLQGKYF